MKKAQELDEDMLKRSIKNQLELVRDQSEDVKELLFNKFYPEVYNERAE